MSNNLVNIEICQTQSQHKRFGICDEPAPNADAAYIDENNGQNWIAVVDNDPLFMVTFCAIDNCVKLIRDDGKPDKICDGALLFENTIIFVELKDRKPKGNAWVKDGELQLKRTIAHFQKTEAANDYYTKKAYVANNQRPRFKSSQIRRMDQFLIDTGYVLRIEGRIVL